MVSEPFLYLFDAKNAIFKSICTPHFDIQEITLNFTFQNGGTRRKKALKIANLLIIKHL